jgi:hypothetical protein
VYTHSTEYGRFIAEKRANPTKQKVQRRRSIYGANMQQLVLQLPVTKRCQFGIWCLFRYYTSGKAERSYICARHNRRLIYNTGKFSDDMRERFHVSNFNLWFPSAMRNSCGADLQWTCQLAILTWPRWRRSDGSHQATIAWPGTAVYSLTITGRLAFLFPLASALLPLLWALTQFALKVESWTRKLIFSFFADGWRHCGCKTRGPAIIWHVRLVQSSYQPP